jgi:DNA polymerase-3 subunit beta
MKTFYETPTEGTAAFCLNGKLFTEIVKNLPNQDLVLSIVDTATLKVKSGKKYVNMNIISGEDFPIGPKYEHFTFSPAGDLIKNIDKVIYASSDDNTRPNLMCVNLNPQHIIAVDGHRLSLVPNTTPGITAQFLLPATSMTKIHKLFASEDVEICMQETNAHFKAGNTVASVRTLDTKYPEYQKVIPHDPYDVATVNRHDFINALKLVSTITDKQKSVVLEFEEGSLKVWAEHHSVGRIEDTIDADFHRSIKIGFNADYLMDVVKRLSGEVISLEVREALKPVIFKEDEYVNVVMPKKL